jgi:DNA-binding transcriptional MerR regulator
MSDESLLTLRQLAEELKLPESTVRYYRDAYLDHIPSVGTGRRRRYPPQAVAVLRSIAKAYATGRPRAEIIATIHTRQGASAPAVTVSADTSQRTVSIEEVTNLDLLAAILDGEREQRDALWQMAKEIVRLTEVLESQDKVLEGIAEQAGVAVSGGQLPGKRAPAQLQSPAPVAPSTPIAAAPPSTPFASTAKPEPPDRALAQAPVADSGDRPVAQPPQYTDSIASSFFSTPPVAAPPFAERSDAVAHDEGADASALEIDPLPRYSAGGADIDRLRSELENERALVERLRESKLQLEHRAADAEAALEDRRGRRPSVLKRLLGSDPEQ